MRASRHIWMSAISMALGIGSVSAQDYPAKPIRIVTSAPGGGSDFISRLIAQGISGPLGQPVIVDNRPNVPITAAFVSKAPPDGYTLLVAGSSLWVYPMLNEAQYNVADFLPISLIAAEVLILAVHPSVPARSIKELIALAKAKPGELRVSTGIPGSPPHLAVQLLKLMAAVNILDVPYKSALSAVTGVVGGEVHLTIYDAALITPHATSGRLRALAVTSAMPSALAPGLPTVASAGLPGYESVGMTGIFAPVKTSSSIINRLNQEVVRVLSQPDVKERLLNAQEEPVGNSPEQFSAYIKTDIARVSKVIKDAKIKVE